MLVQYKSIRNKYIPIQPNIWNTPKNAPQKNLIFSFWNLWRAIARKQEFSGYKHPSQKLRRQK